MIPAGSQTCESGWMRKGIEVRLGPGDRERLEAVIGSRNNLQKHVWRARIVLLSAAGIGTMAIQRQTGQRQSDDLALAGALYGRGHRRFAARVTPPAGKPSWAAAVRNRRCRRSTALSQGCR